MLYSTLSRLRTVVVALMVGGMSLALGGCGGSALTTEQEIRLGQEQAPQFLDQGGGPVPSPEVRTYVEQIGMNLVQQIRPEHQRGLPWEFHVLNAADINAFALPGGKVFISRGLMERLENEAELAAVLGHEIGHVVAEHIGKQIRQQQGLQVGLQVLGAVTESSLPSLLGGVGGQLYLLRFGREQETEADDIGMTYMVRAGYNPQGMVGVHNVLMEAAEANGSVVEFLSTHPDPANRREAAIDRIRREYQFTQGNPQYDVNEQAYEARALAPLRQLPPPAETSMLHPALEGLAHAGCGCRH